MNDVIHRRFREVFGTRPDDHRDITDEHWRDLEELDRIFGTSYAPQQRQQTLFERIPDHE